MIKIARMSDPKSVGREIGALPKGLSFFESILEHESGEELEAGGEVLISESAEGKNGLFIYDGYEATGTIFTKSREAFDRLYGLKPSSYIFSEFDAPELPRENWNIWQLDVDIAQTGRRFRHQVSLDSDAKEIEEFMALAQPETNPRWVSVALRNGDRCFVVKISDKIVGIAWMAITGGTARSHGLYVDPKFRRTGITTDIFHARLLYLKSRHVRTLINEIAEENVASSSHAKKIGERVVGKMFLYYSPEPDRPSEQIRVL